jgi:hypothetical protein
MAVGYGITEGEMPRVKNAVEAAFVSMGSKSTAAPNASGTKGELISSVLRS